MCGRGPPRGIGRVCVLIRNARPGTAPGERGFDRSRPRAAGRTRCPEARTARRSSAMRNAATARTSGPASHLLGGPGPLTAATRVATPMRPAAPTSSRTPGRAMEGPGVRGRNRRDHRAHRDGHGRLFPSPGRNAASGVADREHVPVAAHADARADDPGHASAKIEPMPTVGTLPPGIGSRSSVPPPPNSSEWRIGVSTTSGARAHSQFRTPVRSRLRRMTGYA